LRLNFLNLILLITMNTIDLKIYKKVSDMCSYNLKNPLPWIRFYDIISELKNLNILSL